MSAPAPQTRAPGWYRSGAASRTVPLTQSRGMADTAWTITSRIMAGLLLYTFLGWLLSRWIGHEQLLMAVGALLGLGLSYTLVFRGLAREARTDSTNAPEIK